MAENLDPPRIAGRHFFVDIKTVHFGRNGTSNSTTEAARTHTRTMTRRTVRGGGQLDVRDEGFDELGGYGCMHGRT